METILARDLLSHPVWLAVGGVGAANTDVSQQVRTEQWSFLIKLLPVSLCA